MISLQRKMMLRGQADAAHRAAVTAARVGRTGQVARATVPVGEDDLPVIDVAQDAVNAANELPGVQDGVDNAGADAWESWEQSDYAKTLAQQLDVELTAAQADLVQALADAQTALTDAGLARSEAAQAVSDAAAAASDAAQAVADALAASEKADKAAPHWDTVDPVAGDATGRPVGALWWVRDGAGTVVKMWELTALGWVQRPLNETLVPQIMIGSGTYGLLQGNRLVAQSVTAAQIQALTITANEMAANAVTAVKIAADAVTAEKISSGAVTTVKLDALAVTAEKLAVGAVVAEKIAAGAITAGKIAATAIDGMTITGAVIRTAATGQRMQIDSSGILGLDAAGNILAQMFLGENGGLKINSADYTKTAILNPSMVYVEQGIKRHDLSNGALRIWQDTGSSQADLSISTNPGSPALYHGKNGAQFTTGGNMSFGGPGASTGSYTVQNFKNVYLYSDVTATKLTSPTITTSNIDTGGGTIVGDGSGTVISSAAKVELDAPTIKFRGDTDWVDLSSYINSTYRQECWGRRKYGTIEILISTGTKQVPAGVTTLGTLPAAWRHAGPLNRRAAAYVDFGLLGVMHYTSTGELGISHQAPGPRAIQGHLIFVP